VEARAEAKPEPSASATTAASREALEAAESRVDSKALLREGMKRSDCRVGGGRQRGVGGKSRREGR